MSSTNSEYLVEGMTCSHCVMSVAEEISAVNGVEDVAIDLNPGGQSRVTVATSAPISDDTIRAAVEEAGYTLAATTS